MPQPESRKKFKDDKAIKNYLITIALNKTRNYYRKSGLNSKRHRVFQSNEEMNDCFDSMSSSEQGVEARLLEEEREH